MTSSRKIERIAAAWLARRDAGNWCQHEQTQFDAWLAASARHQVAYLRLQAAWQQSDRLRALGAGVPTGTVPARHSWSFSAFVDRTNASVAIADNEVARRNSPISTSSANSVKANLRRRILFGVGLAALAAAMVLVVVRQRQVTVQYGTYQTAIGVLQSVALADGSEATLNSDSNIVVDMTRQERDINLRRGEAFFKVAKNPHWPFVVSAGARRVIAVGTRFSVRRQGEHVRVIVTKGVVRLESDATPGPLHQPTTLLPAGSIAEIDASNLLVRQVEPDLAAQMLNWRNGYVSFDDTPLATAVAEFNRYNQRKIVIADPSVAAMRIGGNFRWSNAEAFVRLLEQGFALHAEQRGDSIILQRRQSALAPHNTPAQRRGKAE